MTRFAWVLNLDADFELTHARYSTAHALRDALAKNGTASHALLGPDDVLARPGLAADYVGRAWCPTTRAIAQLRASGVEPEPHPAQAILRRVNHRAFAHALGGGLPRQHYVETRTGLDAILAANTSWLLKRPLTFAGRGQLRIEGRIDSKQSSWIDKSLRADGLIVEPLVTPLVEVSVHGFIWRDGRSELGHVCEQTVSPHGVFREARRADTELLTRTENERLRASASQVAAALFAAGYFGPFGIDGYRYTSIWGDGFCALSEINARYTLGFAVGFTQPVHTLAL